MIFKKIIFFVLVCFVLFLSCEKAEDVSPIPKISYYSMSVVPATSIESKHLEVKIDFIDGDGDISFYEGDTVKNIIYSLYSLENDTFKLVDLVFPYHFKIPFYQPLGTNKVLQGKIKTKFFLDDLQLYDTIRFSCYIFDRKYNESNLINTPVILVDTL